MKKRSWLAVMFVAILLMLSGCNRIGDKSGSISIVYGVTSVAALLILCGYCCTVRKKDPWYLLLFSSVFVVNAGYMALALSGTLEEALLANRVSYLGSVCLPLSMLMIIVKACGFRSSKHLGGILAALGAAVFLIAASPGYLDIYYSDVQLVFVNGVAVLEKVYGPWHCVYLFYLLAYFAAMVAVIALAWFKKRMECLLRAAFIASAVFVNMGIWLLEQLVRIDFELLAVSYIISSLFLLALCLLDQERPAEAVPVVQAEPEPVPDKPQEPEIVPEPEDNLPDQLSYFRSQLPFLTPTERIIYDRYLAGSSTKEIMAELNIKENTLKYHNKNIYGKLGVSSRKQLIVLAMEIKDK